MVSNLYVMAGAPYIKIYFFILEKLMTLKVKRLDFELNFPAWIQDKMLGVCKN
jgi:hypothetical protein